MGEIVQSKGCYQSRCCALPPPYFRVMALKFISIVRTLMYIVIIHYQ